LSSQRAPHESTNDLIAAACSASKPRGPLSLLTKITILFYIGHSPSPIILLSSPALSCLRKTYDGTCPPSRSTFFLTFPSLSPTFSPPVPQPSCTSEVLGLLQKLQDTGWTLPRQYSSSPHCRFLFPLFFVPTTPPPLRFSSCSDQGVPDHAEYSHRSVMKIRKLSIFLFSKLTFFFTPFLLSPFP